jgi:hypothetical protein
MCWYIYPTVLELAPEGFERLLTCRPLDSDIAFYTDQFVSDPASVDWLRPIINENWKEAKSAYGSFSDPILNVVACIALELPVVSWPGA